MTVFDPVLAHFGVELSRVARSTELVRPSAPGLAAQLPALLAEAPDPAMALASWERLLDVTTDVAAADSLDPEERRALFTLLGSSQVLANTLFGAGSGWIALLRRCRAVPSRSPSEHDGELSVAVGDPWERFSERLRQLRHREYLRIGLADLSGASVDATMRELSALAAGLFGAAYQWACHILRADYGEIEGIAPDTGLGTEDFFTVLAMGKLGGGELNFSSDVDVMYLYASDAMTSRGGSRGALEARPYFTRLAELITRALHEVTPAGFAFRVDLRLRPDGINGPIVNPVANALLYYESYGQTWERTALIQARPVAGSPVLGDQFLSEVRPFVYRRYLDFTTVADMKEMKARVEAELGEKAGRGNVKLGRGGIREIEFLVQVMQLIHGGRDEHVRGGGSLPTLARLMARGYVRADEGTGLADAYRFLRNVEHKIQIVHERQTHTMPKDAREQETLARRLAYRGADAAAQLWADLDRHTERVRRAFEKLFHEPAAETRRAGNPQMTGLLQTLDDRDASMERLRALGFSRPQNSYDNLMLLRDGSPAARARARRKRVLYEIAPALLGAILKSPDPDRALENLATFISSIGARTSFLALLRENPGTLRMLVEMFGASQFLTNAFMRHPELLDTLVRADLVRVHRSAAELAAELDDLLAGEHHIEDQLDVLRRFRNQEFLRIGINDLQKLLEPEEVSAELTTLAEVCLRSACDVAAREVCARYGWQRLPGRLVVLGMGKLGSHELNYNSDLDLIFIFDEAEGAGLSAHEAFSKFAQRLITVLQVTTREGIVYRIDTRLRPSGRSGPLVSTLEGFAHYHDASAQVWERQALIKARPVVGDADVAARVTAIVSGFVYRDPLTAAEVHEIRRLRRRMERELARESRERINIKTGRGGLIDIEFLTQMLQLHHGVHEPRVRVRATLAALRALGEIGILGADDVELLSSGYQFLRRVENSLRLAYDRPVEDLDRSQMDLSAIAKRLGFAGDGVAAADALWHEYEVRREAIRACYERWFDRAEASVEDRKPPPSFV